MQAVHLTALGTPTEVLEAVTLPEPGPPGPGQILIGVDYAPVNPSDLLVARGLYAFKPVLPSVIGNEGVGHVLAVGPSVQNVGVGDRVLVPLSAFSWRERLIVAAEGLFALPKEADLPQLAMLGINPPTAGLLLDTYVDLKPGDWVVQNAANSGVGRWVIALAKARGLKTLNIVRRAELVDELKALGADAVIVDGPEAVNQAKLAAAGEALRLAFDGVGGAGTATLGAILSPRGTLVSYSAMSGAPASVSSLDLIFKPLTLRGFFMGHQEYAAKIPPLLDEAAALLAKGQAHVPVAAVYPLASIKQAVAHVQRGGKVLLNVSGAA